ncbi:MAG: hypothetical protein IT428_20210 [Planctomycetaceae bacterium]|nr:hypothetical protein [Planctomycetaceae bacterium]
MYETYWGLQESPFRGHADERWFFESPGHSEALARLFFLTEEGQAGGVLVGQVGTGKTLMLRLLAHHVVRSRRQCLAIDMDGLDGEAFAWRLAGELRLGVSSADGAAAWWRAIDDAMSGTALARRHMVILLDHADAAGDSCRAALERLLTGVRRAPGRVTLVAAVRDTSPAVLNPLRRMAALRVELPPFDVEQTARYVAHTLHRAGCQRNVFETPALRTLFERTHGVPRYVNQLCELSLLAAMHDQRDTVPQDVVLGAAAELCLPA